MVADGLQYLSSVRYVAVFPGMAVFITVVVFNFIGDWLEIVLILGNFQEDLAVSRVN